MSENCKENNFGDYEIGFAYKAMGAYAVAGKKTECEKYVELAKEAGEHIKEREDKDLFFGDLETVPGYK